LQNHELIYADEKFRSAIYTLAVGSGRIKERLSDAAEMALRAYPPDNIPPPTAERIRLLHTKLTHAGAAAGEDEGTLNATIRLMSEDDAAATAREIYEIASELEDEYRSLA
jgi:hypothetical protein